MNNNHSLTMLHLHSNIQGIYNKLTTYIGPRFSTSYVVIFFLCSVSEGEMQLFFLLMLVELLTITV